MNMKPSSETFLSRLFLIMLIVICVLLPLLTITAKASAEEPATSTDIVTEPTPAFDFKFQCTGSYSSQVEDHDHRSVQLWLAQGRSPHRQ